MSDDVVSVGAAMMEVSRMREAGEKISSDLGEDDWLEFVGAGDGGSGT